MSGFDGVANTSFVVLDVGEAVGVVAADRVGLLSMGSMVVQMRMAWPGWEWHTVGVSHGWVVAGFNWVLVVVVWDFTHVVGQTLQVVTGHQLLMGVVVLFTTTIVVQTIFLTVHPEWIEQVVVVVMSVQTNILGEVAHGLFWVYVNVPTGVVSMDGVTLIIMFVTFGLFLTPVMLLVLPSLEDNFAAEEVVWVDLVDWW